MASPSCSLCAVLVPRTDRRVLRSPATSSVFSVLSDLTVQLLIHCICGGPLPLLAVCSPGTAAAYAYIVGSNLNLSCDNGVAINIPD